MDKYRVKKQIQFYLSGLKLKRVDQFTLKWNKILF